MAWEPADKNAAILVTLPPTFSMHTMYSIINDLLDSGPSCRHGLVVLDFKKLQRIKVGGVAVLCNLIQATERAGGLVSLKNHESCPASEYLRESGFLAMYGHEPHDRRVTQTNFSPLQKVEYSRSHSYITSQLIPWMSWILGVSDAALASIQGCLSEIFNNLIDHSTVDIACCCAEFDEQQRVLTICITDFGVGIPSNVRKYEQLLGPSQLRSDEKAIAWACQEGYTTRTTPRNMGVGLYYLLKQVCGKNQGGVKILSGKGGVHGTHNPSSRSKLKLTLDSAGISYPGTLFYISIHVDKFKPDHVVEEVFSW